MVNSVLLGLLAYSGIFVGYLVSYLSKEEIKGIKKYVEPFSKLFLLLAPLSLFFTSKYLAIAALLVAALFAIILKNQHISYTYVFFSVIFALEQTFNPQPYMAMFIFLYGMTVATLLFDEKKHYKNSLNELFTRTWCFFIYLILLFIL